MPSRRRFLQTTGAGLLSPFAGGVTRPYLGERFDPLAPTTLDERAATQFQCGLRNRGYVDETVPASVDVDWTMPVNRGDHSAAKSTPVFASDGDVVVAGDTGDIRRVSPAGEVRWIASVDRTSRGIHGTPAIANGSLYVGAYDGALYGFDLASGERRWKTDIGDAIGSSPVYYDGICYIAVEYADPSGSVAAVDARTGAVRWIDHRPTDHPHSTIALALEAGRLVVGSNDGICYAWSFPDLERAWTFQTEGPIKGPVAVHDGMAVFGSWDGYAYAVDLADGREVWSVEAEPDVMTGPAVDPGGTVYVGSHDGSLYGLDGADGEQLWRFSTGGYLIGSVRATPGHALVGSYDSRMYAVDASTGEETWSVEGRGQATSAALVGEDAVYYAERATDEEPGLLYRLVAA
jgi:outer membrane protein assembly factor BamB